MPVFAIISPDGETKKFEIKAGVFQGDTLAHYIFNCPELPEERDFCVREFEIGFSLRKRRSRRKPAVIVTDLDFADDLALLNEEME